MPRTKQATNWEGFDRFLLVLHTDRDLAGEEYERLRSKLLMFFRARGFVDAESLTDETFDRVIRRSAEMAIDSPTAFVLGVARRVASERFKQIQEVPLSQGPELSGPIQCGPDERQLSCLEDSIATLNPEDRAIIETWYAQRGSAKAQDKRSLMDRFSLSAGALRIRAHRIRQQLRKKVEDCLASAKKVEDRS